MVTRALFLLALAAATFAAVCGDALAGTPVTVVLIVASSAPEAGDSVAVTARVKNFPHGSVVVIRVTDSDGVAPVESCKTSVCPGVWTEPEESTATFQAFVRTKAHGGKLLAHSALLAVHWHAAPPPPPPPPSALPGHYCGLSNEGKSVCFDVATDQVKGLRLESNVNCGDGLRWWWWIAPTASMPISQPGLAFSYTYDGALSSSSGATNIHVNYVIGGTFDTAGNVAGTIHLTHITWDEGGKHYDCGGDPRTWTARLGA